MAVLRLAGALLLLAGGVQGSAAQPATVWVAREAYLMGTVLRAEVAAGNREAGVAALERAFEEVRRLEGVLSTWSEESEIARVNAASPGEPVSVSPELMRLLVEAVAWSRRTEGAFDPVVGALVDAWDLRGAGRMPRPEALEEALRASGADRLHLEEGGPRIRLLARDAWVDTGGFGKGAALRAAERVLRANGVEAAMLDFGGQVLVYGTPPEGEAAWEIAVAHPAARQTPAALLRVPGGLSVATSAQSERSVEVDGERYGHVLDPRSGRPVPAWGSVTVVAHDAVTADALSTALLVMGPDAGRRWAAGREEGVLFLEIRDGEVVASWNPAFERYRLGSPRADES